MKHCGSLCDCECLHWLLCLDFFPEIHTLSIFASILRDNHSYFKNPDQSVFDFILISLYNLQLKIEQILFFFLLYTYTVLCSWGVPEVCPSLLFLLSFQEVNFLSRNYFPMTIEDHYPLTINLYFTWRVLEVCPSCLLPVQEVNCLSRN